MIRMKYFTLGEYPQEEAWLHQEALKGNILTRMMLPCFYFFEKKKPEDLIYRYDFIPSETAKKDCISLYSDYGWNYVGQMNSFLLFCRNAENADRKDLEIFSSDSSKDEMIVRIMKKRMVPLMIVCLLLLAAALLLTFLHEDPVTVIILWGAAAVTLIITSKCLSELRNLQKRLV